MPDFSDPLALQKLNNVTPITAPIPKTLWERIETNPITGNVLSGGYSALNAVGFGLPDFLLKVSKSPSYQELKELRERYKLASDVGNVAGVIGGAILSPELLAAKGISKLATKAGVDLTEKVVERAAEKAGADALASIAAREAAEKVAAKGAEKLALDTAAGLVEKRAAESGARLVAASAKSAEKQAAQQAIRNVEAGIPGAIGAKELPRLYSAAKKAETAGPFAQSLRQAGLWGLTEAGETGDIKRAAINTAIGTGLGTIGGKVLQKAIPELAAKGQGIVDFPLERTIQKAGFDDGMIQQGIVLALKKPSTGESLVGRVRPEDQLKLLDPVKEGLGQVINKTFKTPEAFNEYVAKEPSFDMTRQLVEEMTKIDLDGVTRSQPDQVIDAITYAIQALGKRKEFGFAKDVAQTAGGFAKKLKDIGPYAAAGVGLGALTGGAKVIKNMQEGTPVDPADVLKYGAGGLALGLSGKTAVGGLKVAAPAVRAAIAPIVKVAEEPLAKLAGTAAGTHPVKEVAKQLSNVGAKAIAGTTEAILNVPKSQTGAAIVQKVNDVAGENVSNKQWQATLEQVGRETYEQELLTSRQARIDENGEFVPLKGAQKYEDWFEERVLKNVKSTDPKSIIEAKIPGFFSKPEQNRAIYQDYPASELLKIMLQDPELLRKPSFISSLLTTAKGMDPYSKEAERLSQQKELMRLLTAPKEGQPVSASTMSLFNEDLNKIRRMDATLEQKKEAFIDLLRQHYGYNPTYLKQLGL